MPCINKTASSATTNTNGTRPARHKYYHETRPCLKVKSLGQDSTKTLVEAGKGKHPGSVSLVVGRARFPCMRTHAHSPSLSIVFFSCSLFLSLSLSSSVPSSVSLLNFPLPETGQLSLPGSKAATALSVCSQTRCKETDCKGQRLFTWNRVVVCVGLLCTGFGGHIKIWSRGQARILRQENYPGRCTRHFSEQA